MMDPKGKTHCCPDVLSNLPENVIDDILTRVPFRDAVCTSILSKKWRYNWCRLPQLTLDYDLWKSEKDIRYITHDKTVWRTTMDLAYLTSNFAMIIHNIMTLHVGSITRFTLCIQYLKSCPSIDNLLSFLSKKGIQHLVLRLPSRSVNRYELPSSFFTCLQLRHLSLQNCLLLPPPAFKGFDRLISLELHDVTISSKLLESLISHCLLLEQLVLKISDTLSDIVEINAPMLRSCDFTGDLASICLKCVPLMAKLSLRYKGGKKFNVANFFESCSALEHLHLDDMVFSRGQADEIPTKLPFDLVCVKHLCICIYPGGDEILCALCLIRSLPNLQYLEIQMEFNYKNDTPALECLEVEAFSDATFKHLREVKLIETNGGIREMQLIKLLLAKSPALVRMIIMPKRYLEESVVVKRLAKLTEFKLASPTAEVLVLSKDRNEC